MMCSSGARPVSTSSELPKSRPVVMFFGVTLSGIGRPSIVQRGSQVKYVVLAEAENRLCNMVLGELDS